MKLQFCSYPTDPSGSIFNSAVGLQMTSGTSVATVRSNCSSSVPPPPPSTNLCRATHATKRDIYYNDTPVFGSLKTVDSIVDDISCMLKGGGGASSQVICVTWRRTAPGWTVNPAPLLLQFYLMLAGIKNIVSPSKIVLIVEKDATFQTLLDDDFCTKLTHGFSLLMVTLN
uniref:Spo11/DNA topoisomerase VI subunit A N-terminal domain-containing protein n=1 Tax=Hucho hucho TaxID=62062 RepID=A0A4W5MWW1_9TELE